MTFFHDLNKRLAALASKTQQEQIVESKKIETVAKSPLTQALTESAVAEAGYSAKAARAGKDIGKPGKNFAKIAKDAGKRYGSKAAGERVAGAVLNKLRHPTNEGTCSGCGCSPCECDSMEEGNAFTGALAKTPKGGKFKVGGKEFTDTSDLEEGFKEMDAWLASREKEKGTGKFDVKDTGYSKRYTRKHEDEIESDDDNKAKSDAPKKKGRPKSAKPKDQETVTKNSWKYKMVNGKRVKKTDEALDSDGVMMTRPSNMSSEGIEHGEEAEYNDEAGMAKDSLHTIVRHAKELERALRSQENLPEWVQEKIGQIKGMMTSVSDYIISTHERDAEQRTGEEGLTAIIPEKAVSQAQRRAAGIAHAAQKGEIPKSKLRGASKEMAKMAKGELHKFAATKEKGLPEKVKEAGKPDFLDLDKDGDKKESMKKAAKDKKEAKVDETTVAGSVATAATNGKSKGGMQFGQGVYESMDRKFNQALTESINIESTMAECGDGNMEPKLVIQADGEDAAKLMMLLKLAGLGDGYKNVCSKCGSADCGCEELDENSPDWPTNTETIDAEPNLRTYAGGLNGPKSTGQTTVPVVASQLRRQASMEESVELERSLFKTWKNYKG